MADTLVEDLGELRIGEEVTVWQTDAEGRLTSGQGGVLLLLDPPSGEVVLGTSYYGRQEYSLGQGIRFTHDVALPAAECLEFGGDGAGCSGPVDYRCPLSGTGRSFPRCERHWDARLARHEADLRKEAAYRRVDFLDAGERWEDD